MNARQTLNGTEFAMEMHNFPPPPSKNMTNMDILSFLRKKKLIEMYPTMWVALRIFPTLLVTVAEAERNFCKFKLIQTYLRSTIMQTHLCGLSVISIKSCSLQCHTLKKNSTFPFTSSLFLLVAHSIVCMCY